MKENMENLKIAKQNKEMLDEQKRILENLCKLKKEEIKDIKRDIILITMEKQDLCSTKKHGFKKMIGIKTKEFIINFLQVTAVVSIIAGATNLGGKVLVDTISHSFVNFINIVSVIAMTTGTSALLISYIADVKSIKEIFKNDNSKQQDNLLTIKKEKLEEKKLQLETEMLVLKDNLKENQTRTNTCVTKILELYTKLGIVTNNNNEEKTKGYQKTLTK